MPPSAPTFAAFWYSDREVVMQVAWILLENWLGKHFAPISHNQLDRDTVRVGCPSPFPRCKRIAGPSLSCNIREIIADKYLLNFG